MRQKNRKYWDVWVGSLYPKERFFIKTGAKAMFHQKKTE